MNNPNPFLPKGSLLENQGQRRSRLKLGVSCVLAVSVAGLVVMLIQGCKRDEPAPEINPPDTSTNTTPEDTNTTAMTTPDTNVPPGMPPEPTNATSSTMPPQVPPPQVPPPQIPPPNDLNPNQPPAGPSGEYVVAKGDTLGHIARKNGVTLRALEDANPGVTPTRLKLGQKLVIPAGGKAVSAGSDTGTSTTGESTTTSGGTEIYTVKSGDTLHKIAVAHHTTVKAIERANHMTTTTIKVGKKLKIPTKAGATEAAPVAPETVNAPSDTAPAPSAVPPAPVVPVPSTPGK